MYFVRYAGLKMVKVNKNVQAYSNDSTVGSSTLEAINIHRIYRNRKSRGKRTWVFFNNLFFLLSLSIRLSTFLPCRNSRLPGLECFRPWRRHFRRCRDKIRLAGLPQSWRFGSWSRLLGIGSRLPSFKNLHGSLAQSMDGSRH